MTRKGFTLIELLVVIAIIAILAAILFPVFSRVRLKAQQARCQSNLKQLSVALKMYESDYGDRTPILVLYGPGSLTTAQNQNDVMQLDPYLGAIKPTTGNTGKAARQVLVCPSFKGFTGGVFTNYYPQICYGPGSTSWFSMPSGALGAPAELIVFGDGGQGRRDVYMFANAPATTIGGRAYGLTQDPAYWPGNSGTDHSNFYAVHQGKANFAFHDGHVKTMDLGTLEETVVVAGQAGTFMKYFCPVR
jgi:prepilin-type N-terminal cleavage/methylation domain-containing protein/prepilin-type processing-associated H-X9-DG protein